MTSTAANTPHVGPTQPTEPTQTPETAEFGPVAQPGVLSALCAAGSVRLFRQRGSGTLRALPYLAPGTHGREAAEYLADLVDEGASVATAATATGQSRASVRRALASLELAYEIEGGDYDDLVEPDLDSVILAGEADEEGES